MFVDSQLFFGKERGDHFYRYLWDSSEARRIGFGMPLVILYFRSGLILAKDCVNGAVDDFPGSR